MLNQVSSPTELFFLQAICMFFVLSDLPTSPIFLIYFPILKRFTCYSLIYASSRAIVYVITSFGLVYLTEYFGYFGLWFIMIPASIGFIWGVRHIDNLERERNDYHPVNRASAEFALKRFQEEIAASRYSRLQEEKKYSSTQEKTFHP